jgi:hypothetical protein
MFIATGTFDVYVSYLSCLFRCLLLRVLKQLFIILQGSNVNQKYPYIVLGSVAVLATVTASFLPETLHKKLPENIKDAKYFGNNQKFWTFFHKCSADKHDRCLN